MKKLFLLVSFIFCVVLFANAQLYVGGSLGVNSTTYKPEAGEKTSLFGFSISPEVGYSLNDKMDIGLEIGFSIASNKTEVTVDKINTTDFSIAPYFRYSFCSFGKFKILGKASLFFGSHNVTTTPLAGDDIEIKSSRIGLAISPLFTYDVSDKLVLFTSLNFLNIGFTHNMYKDAGSETNFNLGLDMNNIKNLGNVTIGAAYKF
ncbi:MAG: porin family protein [Bacteroidales bacterium]|jgi:hypothetical protein|nr:porin family protein [Bacteroidales bacterium]